MDNDGSFCKRELTTDWLEGASAEISSEFPGARNTFADDSTGINKVRL